uniref:Peptidase S1 domain-containing protein n=1 Tax=Anopheles farauti TaxID=69004 RepID=A0A9I3GJH1_9DIPT
MFFEINGKWFVRGIVSFTPGRDYDNQHRDKPTVFTDVKKYVGWIKPYIDERVLHDESEVIVDYDEKLQLFNFETCGKMIDNSPYAYAKVNKVLPIEKDISCFATFISNVYAIAPAQCFPNLGIKSVAIHPKFDSATYAYDIALIEMYYPVERPAFRPMCLPVTPEMRIKSFENLYFTFGLGITAVTHLNQSECEANHTYSRLLKHVSRFCVEPADDVLLYSMFEGAPFFQKRTRGGKEQGFLLGILSLGYFMNSSRAFFINDINEYIDWILYNMKVYDPEETQTEQYSLQNASLPSKRNEPDERWWKTLNDRGSCGEPNTYIGKWYGNVMLPWIGWLQRDRHASIVDMRDSALATLIHARFALAAAVVMENTARWRFITFGALGSYFACQAANCEYLIRVVEIRDITIHPNYTKSPRQNDIALIEVWPEMFKSYENIQPICLPWTEDFGSYKTARLTVSTNAQLWINERQLERVNSTNCQQRFLANGYHVEKELISICAIYSKGQEPVTLVPGAPLQAEVILNGSRRYFLSGLSYDVTSNKIRIYPDRINTFFMPLIFIDINNYLDWILEEVYRVYSIRFRVSTNGTLEKKNNQLQLHQVHLSAFKSISKNQLLNFNKCGVTSLEKRDLLLYPKYPKKILRIHNSTIPWFGLFYSSYFDSKQSQCAIILVSDWYGISTASCANNSTGLVGFWNGEIVHLFPVRKVIVHSDYHPDDLNNNIAVVQLASSASNITQICLPLVDSIRTLDYERSKLGTYVTGMHYSYGVDTSFDLFSIPSNDRYVDSIYCEIYRNESKPKHERHSKPLNVNSTICVRNYDDPRFYGLETKIEGSPMFSLHVLDGVERHFLRGISLRSGTMADTASMFYLEIDDYLEWILDNMNDMSHSYLPK